MGTDDKARQAMDKTKGKVKEGWGELTDDEQLQHEGRADQAQANAERVADAEREGRFDSGDDSGVENR